MDYNNDQLTERMYRLMVDASQNPDLGKRYPIKTGVIVWLDFLGINDLPLEDARHFLNFQRKAIQEAKFIQGDPYYSKKPPKQFTIADSWLFIWELEEGVSDNELLMDVSKYMRHLFIYALEHKYYLRGAISYGNYLDTEIITKGYEQDEKVICLYDSAYDCAKWFDKANWVGIIYTPRTSIIINEYESACKVLINSNAYDIFMHYFIKGNVPMKCSELMELWVPNWPWVIFSRCFNKGGLTEGKQLADSFFSDLSKVPADALCKYQNTKNFIEECLKSLRRNYPSIQ